jgi:uncharacterized protein (DUF1330 family)
MGRLRGRHVVEAQQRLGKPKSIVGWLCNALTSCPILDDESSQKEQCVTAYIVVDIEVTDPEHYKNYVETAPAFVHKYQGSYLVRGGNPETREGDWVPSRVVILKFPSRELAVGLLEDAEYQAVARIRQSSTVSKMVLVEGYDD